MKNVVPGDSAVSCLDVDPGVCELAPHYIVGKVWLQDMEIGIYRNLQITPRARGSLVHKSNKFLP